MRVEERFMIIPALPISLVTLTVGCILSKGDEKITLASALVPQALTYIVFRAYESGIFKRDHVKKLIRESKKRPPYGPKITIEQIVDDVNN